MNTYHTDSHEFQGPPRIKIEIFDVIIWAWDTEYMISVDGECYRIEINHFLYEIFLYTDSLEFIGIDSRIQDIM